MAISKIPGKGTNNLFNNISDAGTEGTKIASGTTAQRGTTTGQFRFNSTTGKFEGRQSDGSFVYVEQSPTVTSISPTVVESAGGGNVTCTITGTNFSSGATAKFVANDATILTAATTTVDSSTQITAVIPESSFVNSKEPYDVRVTSATGLNGNLDNQINVDNAPTFTTSAGNLGNVYMDINANHFTIAATDPEGDAVTFTEQGATNIAGAGLSLSTAGVISGDATDVGSDTTVSFTARATAGSKTADRAFSFVVKPGLGTAANPATSAKQLYDAGYTTNGIYYFNNIFTGNQDKQAYARFDVKDNLNTNKLHLQRIDFGHLSNYDKRTYNNCGSLSLTRNSGNATDLDVNSGSSFYYEANSSTGCGVSAMVDTGLKLQDLHGFTTVIEMQQTSTGDGNNSMGIQFDFSSTLGSGAGNYGHNYSGDTELMGTATQEQKYYLAAQKFINTSGSTTIEAFDYLGGQFRNGNNTTLWSNFYNNSGDKSNQGPASDYVASSSVTSSEYIGVRFRGWADHTANKSGHYAFWIGVSGS